MKQQLRLPDIMAVIVVVLALAFFAFNISLYLQTDSPFQILLPDGFLATQIYFSLSVVICLACSAYAVWSIDKRKRLAEQAAENAQYLREVDFRRAAIDMHTITSASDEDGGVLDVNENFQKVFGYTRDEIIGKNHSILYKHKHLDEGYLQIRNAVLEKRVWSGEQKLVSKTNEPIFVNTTIIPQFDKDGKHLRSLNIRTDTTAYRRAEANRFLTLMLEELQDEVYIYDVDTLNITYVNRSARARCNWSEDESQSKRINDSSPDFDEIAFRHHVSPLMTGEKAVATIEVMHSKGPVEIATRLYEDLGGQKVFVSVLRDISWRKKVEDAKMESVSIVSHELRTPLTSIKGSLRLLQSGVLGVLEPKAQNIVDIAVRNSDRLVMMVSDILDLEKIEAGQMDFRMEKVNLVDLLTEAAQANKGYGDEHSVKFEIDSAYENAAVLGNHDRLMQVMTNLMSNAAKYSPADGVVKLTISQHSQFWRVSVIDSGPGIPESARDTMFKPFSQQASTDGKKRKGTGLGLVIVKTILKRHHARIDYKSEIGVGTEFFFDIPLFAESVAPSVRRTAN
jgi:PAS domain S-box-containing protein